MTEHRAGRHMPDPLRGPMSEALDSETGAEVVVRCGDVQGRILVYGKRIAWVHGGPSNVRLGDLLREYAPLSDDVLRDVVVRGRRLGLSFGEVLLGEEL
ncbi:MAG: hypothetical protein AAFY60_10140, partial [Myxococcota bacterium]